MAVSNQKGMLAEGTVFGHYEIVRHLGSGGMGSVYVATHSQLGKRVALKTLLPQYASNDQARTRFLREGKLAAKLSHPHVVAITDFGIEDEIPYLVMEFLEGQDLAALLEERERLYPQQIADLMVPVTAALASAHDQQIVHRDLKPQNIFLSPSKSGELVPKVLDFGISKLLGDADGAQLTGSLNLLGTPAYMSPEQARSSKSIDARSDQYTLAVIVYQCVTGGLPFASEGIYDLIRQVVEGHFQPPGDLVPGLPPDFEALILKGMANRAEDRFATTREFGAALLPFSSLRTQVVWEAEMKGGSATFVAKPGGRSSSNQELPAVAPVSRHPSLPHRPDADEANAMGADFTVRTPNVLRRKQGTDRPSPMPKDPKVGPANAEGSGPPANSRSRDSALPRRDPSMDGATHLTPAAASSQLPVDSGSQDRASAQISTRRWGVIAAAALGAVGLLGVGTYVFASDPPTQVAPVVLSAPVPSVAPSQPAPSVAASAVPAVPAAPVTPSPTALPTPTAPAPEVTNRIPDRAPPTAPAAKRKHVHAPQAAPAEAAPVKTPAAPDCDPPYTVDSHGHRIPKAECP